MSIWNIKMESKDELKDIDIKNYACYNLDDEIKYIDINFRRYFYDALLDENLYEDILIYGISQKTSMRPKSLLIRFDK